MLVRSMLVLVGAAAPLACAAAPDPSPSSPDPGLPLVHTTPLDWTLGEWAGVRRSADDGEAHPISVRVTPILSGAGQLREMTVEHDGGVYRGMSIQLREADTGQWTRYYANDVRGRVVTLVAQDEVGDELDVWRSTPNEDGRASENRSERPDDETWLSTVSRTTDGGETWSVVFVDELERRR